jgi:hypothetical protein
MNSLMSHFNELKGFSGFMEEEKSRRTKQMAGSVLGTRLIELQSNNRRQASVTSKCKRIIFASIDCPRKSTQRKVIPITTSEKHFVPKNEVILVEACSAVELSVFS